MRLNVSPSWDLTASVLISVFSLVLVHLSPLSTQGFSTILGFILAVPFPGYLLMLSMFPAQSDPSSRRRALLSIGLSAILVVLVSLVFIPKGFQLNYVATILSLLTILLAPVAYVRWSALPRRRRSISWLMIGSRSKRTPASPLLFDAGDRVVSLLCDLGSIGASALLAALAYFRWTVRPPRKRSVVWLMRRRRSGRSLASSTLAGTKGQFVSVLFVLVIICALAALAFTNNTSHSLSNDKGSTEKGDHASPYQGDHLWINSYNIESNKLDNSSHINDSEMSTQISEEQNNKVVVMEGNNGNSSGNSTSSGEKPSFPESNEKISIQGGSSEKSNEKSNQRTSSEPSSNETAGSPSLGSSKENQTANPADLQEISSNKEMGLSNSSLSVSSGNKTAYSGANMTVNATNDTIENQNSNSPPFLPDLYPNKPNPQIVGTTIIWMANASDPDGDMIFYKFILNDKAMTDWSASNSLTWNTSSVVPGDYRIKVLIRDNKHAAEDSFDASKEVTFTLAQSNQRPVLEDFRPDINSPQAPGKGIVWTANATDPDRDLVLYKFFVNNKPATVWLKFNTFNWVTTRMPPGDYRIKVLIRDGKHASEDSFDASKEVTFTLAKPNQRPVLEDLRPDMDSPQAPGKSIAWKASAVDSDGDVLSYKFILNDKAMTDWSASNSWTWNTSSLTPGDYRIKVLIRNGKRASEDSFDASKEVIFTLAQPNQRPALDNFRPDTISPQAPGKSIVWTVNATDPGGDVISYKFLLNDKAMTDWSASNSWTWNTSSLTPGDYRIKVLIRNGKRASEDSFDASKEVIFTLAKPNQRPDLEDLRSDIISPQAPGKSIAWTANATDPDGDVIFYKFILNDKAVTDWSASNSWTWNTSSLTPGAYRIKVLIRDGKHSSEDSFDASKEVVFTLTQPNQRPVLVDLRPDMNSSQAPGKSIVWTANATDPDGDQVLYKFFVNNQPATVWLKFNTFNWVTTRMPPGNYRIKVLIRDGKHSSEDSFDASKEMIFTLAQLNQRPVLEYLRPDMDSPQAPGKSIAWKASAADSDGYMIFYKFLLNDKAMTDWSASNSWTWNTSSAAPGNYRIKVLIRDGKHASEDSFDASKDATFTILASNRPPVLKSLKPVINSPQASRKSIVWTSIATDPDGDVISYKFLLNDKAVTDWSASNSWTWNTSSVEPGDYRIEVLIRDGKHASYDAFDGSKETTFTLNK